MHILNKDAIVLWTTLIFFLLIGILFYYTRNHAQQNQELAQSQITDQTLSSTISPPSPLDPAANSVRIIEDTKSHTVVRYENGIFEPHEITVIQEAGCVVAIENKSDQDIIPRLGPFIAEKETGFLYSSIAPAHTGFIDPRYATSTRVSFYNKNKPDADFLVNIDPACF